MGIKKYILALSAVVFLFGATSCDNDSRAQGSQIQFTNSLAGSFVNGTTDTNNDGFSAAVLSLQGLSTELGVNKVDSKIELAPIVPNEPCLTPNGGSGFEASLVHGTQVITLDDNDQLFIELEELQECIGDDSDTDPSFSFEGGGSINGGTGEFEGATGTIAFSGTGTFLITDNTGFFGSTKGEIEGVIELN